MISSLIAFVVVLGILIFVHELGHFVMAKRFGVGVEKFSLGFGPKLFGRRYGETEYLISAIPLGGYVKMVGEDPKEELPPEERKRSFSSQSVARRFWIVFAGPSFNIIFAVIVFWAMFIMGYPSEDTTLGWVKTSSPAWDAGLRAGDRVLSVNGEPITLWDELSEEISESGTDPLTLEIERDDTVFHVTVQALITDGKNIFGENEKSPAIGIQHHTLSPVIGVADPYSPAGRNGLTTGDLVLSVNDEKIESFPDLEQAMVRHLSEEIRFDIQRDEEKMSLVISLTGSEFERLRESGDLTLERLGLFSAELFVKKVEPGSPSEEAGIQMNDRIVEVDGKAVYSFMDLQEIVSEKAGIALPIKLVRAGEFLDLRVTPEERTDKDALGNKVKVGKIGIYSSYYPKAGPTILVHYNPLAALFKAAAMTWEFTVLILVSLVKLIQQVIPAETLGGPILIAQLAGQQIQYGLLELFKFMALISINLGILNLLPIPILDGGHILFFAIEGLRGRPVSMKKMEMAQQVGLLLLLSLILFVTYNDIMRIFG